MSLSANTITPETTPALAPPYRGLLRNNNPSGNPNAAPRCGAKNRAGLACQAPAMPNGRCRCHGGKSTGPRTPEGKARSATANIKHGNTTAPQRTWFRYIRTLITRNRVLCRATLLWPYLPPALSNRLAEGPEELWTPIHPSNLPFVQTPNPPGETTTHPGASTRRLPRTLAAERAAARTEAAALAPWRHAIAQARTAKRDRLAANRADRATRRAARAARRAARTQATQHPTRATRRNAPPEAFLPPPETPLTDYTPLERELAARLAGMRTTSPAENPNSSIPRINPMNPERPAATPNPDSALPRCSPPTGTSPEWSGSDPIATCTPSLPAGRGVRCRDARRTALVLGAMRHLHRCGYTRPTG